MLRKTAGTIITVFIIAWIIRDPATAGISVHHWINGALTFMQHIS